MEELSKHEPQDANVSGAEESKQPQSLVLQESPLVADLNSGESQLLRRYREFRNLQSQIAHLRAENEELRRQLRDHGIDQVPEPAELKWLIYFRAPASKAQVLSVVREGLAALFAREPSFRGRECATFWAAQERSGWQAFRVDYVGDKLAAFRTAMKAAYVQARLPASEVRTTQPPSVTLYRQLPQVPPLFTGTLEELAGALEDAMEQVFM